MNKIKLGSVVQVGIVVRDALAAANAWTERFALEPAQVVDWPPEGSNIYSEFLEEKGEGLHHLLFRVADPMGVAQELAVDVTQSGGSTLDPGAVWAYLDTEKILGTIIELKTKREAEG